MELALRAFEPQTERQLVLVAPVPLVHQRRARGQIRARRGIGSRRLRLLPGTQVDCRHPGLLLRIDDQRGASIELVRDLEQLFGKLVRRHIREQLTADTQMNIGEALFGN